MTPKEFAKKLNGREYGSELTRDEEKQAKDLGLLVVYGYSDDNIEFRGAFDEEVGCYDGGTILITKDGPLEDHDGCQCEFCGFKEASKSAKKIECKWSHNDYSWFISTKLPHATFDIMEDGEKFCRGIVIAASDLAA